jgi:hypothetical protein
VKSVEDDLRALSYKYFAAESRNTDFEFHGDAIYNGRGRYFKKISLEKRLEILRDIISVALRHTEIQLGYVSINKSKYFGNIHVQQAAFSLMVERIEEILKGNINTYCLLIADEQDELEQRLIDDLDHFKQHGTHFGYKNVRVERIIDSVHFVQSKNNYLMQLTDVLCYVIRKGKEAQDSIFTEWHNSDSQLDYRDFLAIYSHKGKKFFLEGYQKIGGKIWAFTKDFPQ